MATKRAEERVVKVGKASNSKSTGAQPVSINESKASPPVSQTAPVRAAAPARPASVVAERKRPAPAKPSAPPAKLPGEVAPPADGVERGIQGLRGDLRDLKEMMQKLASQTSALADTFRAPAASDEPLDGAMNSLRRLLSELLADHVESVIKDLVDVRRDATGLAGGAGARLVERLDHTLEKLGAVRFEAETMDVVDPLIHVVVEERHDTTVPDGVILAALRPGFRTGRGLVVCKAGVAANRRA